MKHKHLQPHEFREEAIELFRLARDVPDLIKRLQKIKCHPCLCAVSEELITYWHQQEICCHELTGCYNIDGQWQYTWPNIDHDIRIIVQGVSQLPSANEDDNQQQPSTFTQTKTTNTMPLFINRQEGVIHNYDHCTIYQGLPQNAPQPSANTPSTPTTTDHIMDFAQLFTINYREKRKDDFENMLAILHQQHSDIDRARFALAIYQSNNLLPATRPATFKTWMNKCNQLLQWNIQTEYKPYQLEPNETTQQLMLWL
jgi:hypothetical protein